MKIIYSLIFILLYLLLNCFSDAPRDNPLDTGNNMPKYQLNGFVQTYYPNLTNSFLRNARITLVPSNEFSISDADGYFFFNNLSPGTYVIYCQATGFVEDSMEIKIENNKQVNFRLDGLPYFKNISISTHHISRWFPVDDLYFLQFAVAAGDTDGVEELDIAEFEIADYSIRDTLDQSVTAGKFDFTFFLNDYGIASLHQLIGKPFMFYIKDNFGATQASDKQYINRIIEETPVLLAPVELTVIQSIPFNIQWERIFLPYPFTLKIEIFRIVSGLNIKVAEIPNISGELDTYSYGNVLSPGDYFWTLYIKDEFGNESRSKEGSFRIP